MQRTLGGRRCAAAAAAAGFSLSCCTPWLPGTVSLRSLSFSHYPDGSDSKQQ